MYFPTHLFTHGFINSGLLLMQGMTPLQMPTTQQYLASLEGKCVAFWIHSV